MLYFLIRPVARYVLRYYFRRIDIQGLEHIPQDGAVILAANHPTAFIEPCLLACFQSRPLHFLARGDLYKTKWASWVLRALRILPVYRLQDGGYGKLTENYATFAACHRVLSGGGALMILAEGRCIHEKRLRPLRKGTARVALGALDRDATLSEVYVVPVGVNFVAADRVRSEVYLRCGSPLKASDYLATYRQHEATGLRELTDELRQALSPLVLQLPDPATDALYEAALDVVRSQTTPGTDSFLAEQLQIAKGPPDARAVGYRQRLTHLGLSDRDVLHAATDRPFPWISLVALPLLLPQLPLWGIAEWIALTGPRTIEFYSPVRFAVLGVGTLLYFPLLWVLPVAGVVYLLVSLLLTDWSLRQFERLREWRGARRAAKLPADTLAQLRTLREELLRD